VRGQDAEDEAAPVQASLRWDYKTEAWSGEDVLTTLRAASEDEMGSADDMLRALAEEIAPRDNPAVQRAVDARLGERLTALGAAGWELVWVREGTTVVSGYMLPAPTLVLKRQRK
jgi:hypothetical protein